MITLYHGSNVPIKSIDLSMSKPDKDFGSGFYLTDIKEQAHDMAIRRVRILGTGEPVISAFSFNEDILVRDILNVKIFDGATVEWAEFILKNRFATRMNFRHDYDIVIGPIADDGVAFQLGRYEKGLITLEQLADELKYKKLSRQYFFGTGQSIQFLTRL